MSLLTQSSTQSGTRVTRLQAQWCRAAGWVSSLGEHRPSLQTLHWTPHQHGQGSGLKRTYPASVTQSVHPHQFFSAPTRWHSEAPDQTLSPGLRKLCRVSCKQLDTSIAPAWQQTLRLLCLCLGWSQTENSRLTPTVWWGRPKFSPRISWPALSAWDRGSLPFPMHRSYLCWGRQWNSAPSQRVPCHREWLQLRSHGSWRRPYHRLLVSSLPLCLIDPVLCPLHVRDILLNHIYDDWNGRAFYWWFRQTGGLAPSLTQH